MPDKSRYVYLYLPSAEDKTRWGKMAHEAGVPLSKFIIEVVESSLSEATEFKPRGELVKEIGKLRSENKALRDDLNQKKIVLERYETELRRYRNQAFVENEFEGLRKYERQLVEALKRGFVLDSNSLLAELGIDPNDSHLVKALSNQLGELEAFGLISSSQRGWRWIG